VISPETAGAELPMTEETIVTLKLNQQQLELIDRTIARGVAPDRAALVRLALHEYAATHAANAGKDAQSKDAK
jgi:Arc/MetJ-type ribon-helix-helix transcriptional regulator